MGISAPGEKILSTTPSNSYTAFSGTSMATPQVAGLIAVMKALKPSLTTQEIYNILQSTGHETNSHSGREVRGHQTSGL
jgi:subtilisin family serine protease